MNKKLLIKTLALGVVVLFVSVSFQPVLAINSKSKDETIDNKSNNENKLEYIIEITKENKVISYSVFLTEKEANDLDILIKSIHSKLNNSKSNEDTAQIYYDAVDSFNGLGIFPDNISINEVKQLVTGENRNLDIIRFKNEMGEGFQNRLCLIASNTTDSFSIGPIFLLTGLAFIPFLSIALFLRFFDHINITKFKIFYTLTMIHYWLFKNVFFYLLNLSKLSANSILPVSVGSLITYGDVSGNDPYQHYRPSYGWIFTIGINGVKIINGNFYGQYIPIPFLSSPSYYIGIIGFIGMSIRGPDKTSVFRLGFGLDINVNTEPLV